VGDGAQGGCRLGGLVFDYYSADDYKYATLGYTGALTIGHMRKGTSSPTSR
jgi:hypothetical protein